MGNMAKKITTNSLDLAKQIVKWDYDKENGLRDEQVALITAYGMNYLSSRYDVSGKNINVDTGAKNKIRSRDSGSYSLWDDNIKVSNRVTSTRHDYGNDLITLFHETFHFGQTKGKNENGNMYSNKSYLFNSSFPDFVVRAVRGGGIYNGLTEKRLIYSEEMTREKAEDYVKAKYNLDPAEVGAKDFSYEAVKSILDMYNDNPKEFLDGGVLENINTKRNIATIESELKQEKSLDMYRRKRAEKEIANYDDYYCGLVEKFRTNITQKDDMDGMSVLDNMAKMKSDDLKKFEKDNGDVYSFVLQGLIINYDEKFASDLVDNLLAHPSRAWDKKEATVLNIVRFTNYEMTDQQFDRLERIEAVRGGSDMLKETVDLFGDLTIGE